MVRTVAKGNQTGANERQKEPEGSHKGAKGRQKETRGAKREPRGDQKASKNPLGRQGRFLMQKGRLHQRFLGAILFRQVDVTMMKNVMCYCVFAI